MIKTFFLGALAVLALSAAPALAAPEIGKAAPDFTATDSNGKEHKLSDFKGKIVVLEWNNPECPYVKKHYDAKNMQKLQEEETAKGVVWLTVNSGAEGKQGHLTGDAANAYIADKGAKPTAYLLDGKGEIGKAYDAKTTPHMYVIDQSGNLAYEGAIDDNDSANPADASTAQNYVSAAIDALEAGKPVETSKTKPYGCGVKYE